MIGPLDQRSRMRCSGAAARSCGIKRTKNWTDIWLAKLREDQRKAKADIALIITTLLAILVVCLKPVSINRTLQRTIHATKSGRQRRCTAWTWQ